MSEAAGWPPESILLYVPPRKNQAKGIETFAFDEHGIVRLNEHPAVMEKVGELGRDYKQLWRLIVLVHPEFREQALPLSEATDVLVKELWSEFSDAVDVNFHEAERLAVIQETTWFSYIQKEHREAAEDMQDISIDLSGKPIPINWGMFERAPVRTTLTEGALSARNYAERAFLLQSLVEKLPANLDPEERAVEAIGKRYPLTETKVAPVDQRRCDLEFEKQIDKSLSGEQKRDAKRAFELNRIADEVFSKLETKKTPKKSLNRAKDAARRRKTTRSQLGGGGRRASTKPPELSARR